MPAPVSVHVGPPSEAWTPMTDFAGGANPIYGGLAKSRQPQFTFTGATVSKANPAEVTFAAHGLQSDNPVVISGATGDWAGLNGKRAVTVTAANTFTVAVDSSGFAGNFDGAISTTAPRTNATCWAITKKYWDANGQVREANAEGSVGADKAWSSRAAYTYA
ncbi:MAG TPA: hypothetical protein VN428_02430 [Bryobacteraceae bacterium]|nr:hypothetical protein [Bryobacteraceae bacterium]